MKIKKLLRYAELNYVVIRIIALIWVHRYAVFFENINQYFIRQTNGIYSVIQARTGSNYRAHFIKNVDDLCFFHITYLRNPCVALMLGRLYTVAKEPNTNNQDQQEGPPGSLQHPGRLVHAWCHLRHCIMNVIKLFINKKPLFSFLSVGSEAYINIYSYSTSTNYFLDALHRKL